MASEFNARFKTKRDTSANWTAQDPVLLNGEIVIVDTASGEVRRKVGDGVKKYSQLPFDDEILRNDVTNYVNEKATKVSVKKWTTEDIGGV